MHNNNSLYGKTICLIFEHQLSHYSRILDEIEILRNEGAKIILLSSDKSNVEIEDIETHLAPLYPAKKSIVGQTTLEKSKLLASRLQMKFLRDIDEVQISQARIAALNNLAEQADAFWVIDYHSLRSTLNVASSKSLPVIYETVDLVPEYPYNGKLHRIFSLKNEADAVRKIDGFITASESYADYYEKRYAPSKIPCRPTVRDNMPKTIVCAPKATKPPLKFLFMGSLMFDRPIIELINSVTATTKNIEFTFIGRNLLGELSKKEIEYQDTQGKIKILDPCPPSDIVNVASNYDVGVVALRGNNENERWASTQKLFTYMSAGLMILGSDLPGIARVVSEAKCGKLVKGISSETWARSMDEIADMKNSTIDKFRANSLKYAQSKSIELQACSYIKVFQDALS